MSRHTRRRCHPRKIDALASSRSSPWQDVPWRAFASFPRVEKGGNAEALGIRSGDRRRDAHFYFGYDSGGVEKR